VALEHGGRVKVIAGTTSAAGAPTRGPIQGLTTDPLYLDVELPAGQSYSEALNADYNAFIYVYEGSVAVGPSGQARTVEAHSAGLLSRGERIEVAAGADGARFLVLAARPLDEPVVQYGPFVMNTRDEIEQAIRDYQSGELAKA
jgi:redox-sensitive bicupin YhaK (pirin superfamily)